MVVLAGAGLGGLARYALGTWIMARSGGRFPSGHLLHQYQRVVSDRPVDDAAHRALPAHSNWRLFLVVGVLGGYTTFSSFEYETLQAVRDGERWMGLLYVSGSVLLGYLAVWLGAALAARR